MIKLIASDLDGTIINHENSCAKETVEQIERVRKMGVAFAISTGRPIASMFHYLKEWGLDGHVDYIIGSNGGEILDVAKNKYVITYALEPEVLKDILTLYQDLPMIPTLYAGDVLYVETITDFTTSICKLEGMKEKQGHIHDLIEKPEIKLMYIVDPENMEMIEKFHADHPDERYIAFKTAPFLFEFTHPLIAKDVGLRILQEIMHISNDEMMAFGDTTNDIEMLQHVKYGIAMNSGSDDAKSVAFDICGGIEENGVANYLKQHLQTTEYKA